MMELTNNLFSARDAGLAAPRLGRGGRGAAAAAGANRAAHQRGAVDAWRKPYSIHQQAWPAFDPGAGRPKKIEVVVQVNGKVRDRLSVAPETARVDVRRRWPASEVKAPLKARPAQSGVFPGRLVNIVTPGGVACPAPMSLP